MLKGWIDRVFSEGWAFTDSHSRSPGHVAPCDNVLVLASAGVNPKTYDKYGYRKPSRSVGHRDLGILRKLTRHHHFFWKSAARNEPPELERRAAEARSVTRFVHRCRDGVTVRGSLILAGAGRNAARSNPLTPKP